MRNAWAAISPNHGNSHCVQITLALPIAIPESIAMLCRISGGRCCRSGARPLAARRRASVTPGSDRSVLGAIDQPATDLVQRYERPWWATVRAEPEAVE